jgi:Cu/Ag efflux protein CusF
MKRALISLAIGLALSLPAWADTGHMAQAGTTNPAAMAAMPSEGVVKKVDKVQGKLTIKHGPLDNLGMPAMTMVFKVKDAAMLDQVKPGDQIRFLAEEMADSGLTVTRLEAVKPYTIQPLFRRLT